MRVSGLKRAHSIGLETFQADAETILPAPTGTCSSNHNLCDGFRLVPPRASCRVCGRAVCLRRESGSREFTKSTEFVTSTRVWLRPIRIAPTKSALQNSNSPMAGRKTFYLVHSVFLYSVLTLSYGSITSGAIGSVCCGSNRGFDAYSWESIAGSAFAVPCEEHHTMFSDQVAYLSFNLTPAASTRAESPSLCFQRKLSGSVSCMQRRHRHALICGATSPQENWCQRVFLRRHGFCRHLRHRRSDAGHRGAEGSW
jgi:hypothetical protein